MGKLYEELKRRKVFRVGAVYAVMAWLIIQVAGEILPTFEAPQWISQSIILLLILGFPMAVILAWAYEITPEGVQADVGTRTTQPAAQALDQKPIYAILLLVLLFGGLQITDRFGLTDGSGFGGSMPSGATQDNTVMRASIILDRPLRPLDFSGSRTDLEISPDGSHLVYTNYLGDDSSQAILLNLETEEVQVLSEGGSGAARFSPDGQRILLSNDSGLEIFTLAGASTPVLVDSFIGPPGNWLSDEELLYTGIQGGPIKLTSLVDGSVETLVPVAPGLFHAYPVSLPDGRAVLYSAQTGMDDSESDIRLFNPEDASSTLLVSRAYSPRYAPTGHITFIRDGDLWAVPFDVDSLRLSGPEVMVQPGIQSSTRIRQGSYAFSQTGRLVYLPGTESSSSSSSLIVVSRDGNERPLDRMVGSYSQPMLSADGQLLAVTGYSGPASSDIWLYDLANNNFARRSFMGDAFQPKFSADGSQIFFRSKQNPGIWAIKSDGAGEPNQIFASAISGYSSQSLADGSLLYTMEGNDSRTLHTLNFIDSVWVDRQVVTLTDDGYQGVLSPDGKWLAYTSSESGREEVYVRAYPDLAGGKYQISTTGGREPLWGLDGEEIIFTYYTGNLMSSRVEINSGFSSGVPEILVSGVQVDVFNFPSYAVSNDGQTFVVKKRNMNAPVIDINSSTATLRVVENWFEDLKRLAPPDPQ